ncbi:hypothetical protein ACC684_28335 [Rhizobium ruizarguesonis]|uniref:hypothetical protein n=1 Tax=Rhizobium leguminosarum TaxID=384 RepID=UPI0013F42B45|nr:hypothetical protein [Rhizobium leguminosarum]MBY5453973.1 hypothetical protein [Rhizobium leguminosarum]
MTTTSLVLSEEQTRILKAVAATRMIKGTETSASVSAVIRKLIDDAMPAFRQEVEAR